MRMFLEETTILNYLFRMSVVSGHLRVFRESRERWKLVCIRLRERGENWKREWKCPNPFKVLNCEEKEDSVWGTGSLRLKDEVPGKSGEMVSGETS